MSVNRDRFPSLRTRSCPGAAARAERPTGRWGRVCVKGWTFPRRSTADVYVMLLFHAAHFLMKQYDKGVTGG